MSMFFDNDLPRVVLVGQIRPKSGADDVASRNDRVLAPVANAMHSRTSARRRAIRRPGPITRYAVNTARAIAAPSRKSLTGISGFDDMTGGGVPRGRTTLVMGGPGSGKTLFGLKFL